MALFSFVVTIVRRMFLSVGPVATLQTELVALVASSGRD